MKKLFITCAVSVVIHGLLFFGIPKSTTPVRPTMMVELIQQPDAKVSKSEAKPDSRELETGRANARPSKSVAHLSAKQIDSVLNPSFHQQVGSATASEQDSGHEPSIPFWDPQNFLLNIKNYDSGNEVRGFSEAVYNEINNNLIFDSILSQYNHFGIVYLEFRVDRTGKLIESSIRAKSRDRILQVHVLRTSLIPALTKALKESLWAKTDIKFVARFEFIRSLSDTTLSDNDPQKIAGTALTFRRFTRERRVARSMGEHLMSGGINYDLFAMYEAWSNYEKALEREKLGTDPFDLYRADKFYDL